MPTHIGHPVHCRDDEQGILRQFYVMMCEECQAALLLLTDYSLYDSSSLFFQIVGQMFNVFLNSVIQ